MKYEFLREASLLLKITVNLASPIQLQVIFLNYDIVFLSVLNKWHISLANGVWFFPVLAVLLEQGTYGDFQE